MANEINGVSAKQEIIVVPQNGTQEAESAKPQEAIVKVPVNNRGMGTQVQSNTNFNLYGSNFENFEKFKGNDKHDAMRMTQTAANDIKKAYMQLQHEFPEAVIAFEPMPDPKACGKKREGFFTYQQMLNDWKDNAMMKINQVRTESTQYVVYNAAGAVMAHDDENADRNAGITVAYGEANLDKTLEQGEKTREDLSDKFDASTNKLAGKIDRVNKNVVGYGNRLAAGQNYIQKGINKLGDKVERGFDGVQERLKENDRRAEKREDGAVKQREAIAKNQKTHDAKEAKRHKETRANQQKEADRIIDTLDPLATKRAIKSVRDAAARLGKSVGDFVKENPEFLIPGLGVPVWAAKKLFQ